MQENSSGQNAPMKAASASMRGRHDLRNMRLTGNERILALVLGNVIAGRLGPKAQVHVLDVLMSEMTQKPKRDELLTAVKAVGLDYDIDEGQRRQRLRDEAVANYRG